MIAMPAAEGSARNNNHNNNISVAIRVRPLSGSATGSQAPEEPWQVTPSSLTHIVYDGQRLVCAGPQFTFDRVFSQAIRDNAAIFEGVARQVIDSAIEGINGRPLYCQDVGTVFAYGQTSAGKTFTLQGSPDNPGLVPLAISYIFRAISGVADRAFSIRVSYMEIYNEVITDLVNAENSNLKIHETNMVGSVHLCFGRERFTLADSPRLPWMGRRRRFAF